MTLIIDGQEVEQIRLGLMDGYYVYCEHCKQRTIMVQNPANPLHLKCYKCGTVWELENPNVIVEGHIKGEFINI